MDVLIICTRQIWCSFMDTRVENLQVTKVVDCDTIKVSLNLSPVLMNTWQ